MTIVKRGIDLLVAAAVITLFIVIAAQRLSDVPVPETDESYTLQVSFEILNRGQLSLPMYRYLGGNIENVWHSYTPLFFVFLSAFLKVFGWGLVQGRVFNLITAALTLVATYVIGRKLFDWRTGLAALVLLASDQTFLERSRLLRNDYAAAAFAMLAFYLYEKAEERGSGKLYWASGLAAGAGVMCHTNVLYMLAAIGLLMLLRHGWRIVTQRKLYQFAAGALVVMAYEIIYDLVDLKNFVLQNKGDKLHFGLLKEQGWLSNLVGEGKRFAAWHAGGRMFLNVPRTALHIFQGLAVVAAAYLVCVVVLHIKRGKALDEPRVRIFVVTAVAVLFHAVIVSHKEIYYMAHLAPWFALCVGIMLSDCGSLVARIKSFRGRAAPIAYKIAMTAAALAIMAFGYELAKEERRYLREMRSPDLASFEEIKGVLRSLVPEGVCPVAMKSPVIWLCFPEADRCFATIEPRMMNAVDIWGREYAVVTPNARSRGRAGELQDLEERAHPLGELVGTAYGNLLVYYTGSDSEYASATPKKFYFFGGRRGHIDATQLAEARELWSEGAADLAASGRLPGTINRAGEFLIQGNGDGGSIELSAVTLRSGAAYEVSLDLTRNSGHWGYAVIEEESGLSLFQEEISEQAGFQHVDGIFRTVRGGKVKVVVTQSRVGSGTTGSLGVARVSIKEASAAL